MVIEQFLPTLHYGDAIGNSTLRIHHYLKGKGIDSRIVAQHIDPRLQEEAVLFSEYRETKGAIKILHFATPSELSGFFKTASGRKVLIYHNITPAHFFTDFSESLTRLSTEARQQLKELRDSFDLAIADSNYNATELEELNFREIKVYPIPVNLTDYEQEHSPNLYQMLKDDRKNILFVGRVTPNKKIEDLVKTVIFYKKYLSPAVRLVVAGNTQSLPKYFHSLKDLAARFYLTAEDVFFTGHITFPELLALYKSADVFLSMSEHEGFCLPLIESCHFRLPVVAYDAGAVADTLGDAGMILQQKDVAHSAAVVERVLEDQGLRSSLQAKQAERMVRYRQESDPEILLSMIRG